MTQSDQMPASGQFVAVYMHEGNPWAQTLRWSKQGVLMSYNESTDEFEPTVSAGWIRNLKPTYITA